MTLYEDRMSRKHWDGCKYPQEKCSCHYHGNDLEFTTYALVEVKTFGLPAEHGSSIIDRIDREMRLAFKGRANVTAIELDEAGNLWPQPIAVVKEALLVLHPKQEVPEVPTAEAG